MNYLERAVELSKYSFESGEFPAGAILVTKSGNCYESQPSLPHNHGEMMAIDAAIETEGTPLSESVIYASMEPCIMCVSKMYWAGVGQVIYALPKNKVHAEYAYENPDSIEAVSKTFFTPVAMHHDSSLTDEALSIYQEWVEKIQK